MHFDFFIRSQRLRLDLPKGEWSIPARCGKLLSGPSVAAMEVYHHGYLISQPHLRDQQGQFSALSTLPPFFDGAQTGSSGLGVTERDSCEDRKTLREAEEDKRLDRTNVQNKAANVQKSMQECGSGL